MSTRKLIGLLAVAISLIVFALQILEYRSYYSYIAENDAIFHLLAKRWPDVPKVTEAGFVVLAKGARSLPKAAESLFSSTNPGVAAMLPDGRGAICMHRKEYMDYWLDRGITTNDTVPPDQLLRDLESGDLQPFLYTFSQSGDIWTFGELIAYINPAPNQAKRFVRAQEIEAILESASQERATYYRHPESDHTRRVLLLVLLGAIIPTAGGIIALTAKE